MLLSLFSPSAVSVLTVTVWKTNKALKIAGRARKEQSLHPISQGSITWHVSYRINSEFSLLGERGLNLLLCAHTTTHTTMHMTADNLIYSFFFFLLTAVGMCSENTFLWKPDVGMCCFFVMYYAEPPECVDAPGENMCSSTFLNSFVFKTLFQV